MNLVKFFEIALKLKEVERTGWVERGVKNPESSSEHSFMVALMTLVLGKKASRNAFNRTVGKDRKLNMEKVLKMAIIHDLPEAAVGDIISKDNWEAEGQMWGHEKAKKERPAMKKLSSLAGNHEILELWEEFESLKSPEASFVKDLDRLATILQAIEYHRKGNYKKPMPPFWDEKGISSIKNPELRKFLGAFLLTVEDSSKSKLVRDMIPEIIRNKGQSPVSRIASDKEYWNGLKEKLREEVKEFLRDEKKEELADILEVIHAICDFRKIDKMCLENFRKNKSQERGGFKGRIILDEVK